MDTKQAASQSEFAERDGRATIVDWGCLIFFLLLMATIGALSILAGGSN